MADVKDDGGPASQMSLRDWFAGQAMSGILANSKLSNEDPSQRPEKVVSEAVYIIADAMIAARKETP